MANAINTFYSNQIAIYTAAGYTSAYIQLQQQVFIVPEPITNNLLISATPRYFDELMRFIAALDAQPAQVVIQCLIAEVDLNSHRGVRRRDGPAKPAAVRPHPDPDGVGRQRRRSRQRPPPASGV